MSRLAHGETVTRLRVVTVVDTWGNSIPGDWGTADRLTVTDCALAPQTEAEVQANGRDATPGEWTLYVPDRHVDIIARDRIETGYGTFDVDGNPNLWRSPFTGREGMTVKLRKVDG